jgi:hypothetical protein
MSRFVILVMMLYPIEKQRALKMSNPCIPQGIFLEYRSEDDEWTYNTSDCH